MRNLFSILKKTFIAYREDGGVNLAAALSFYAILSLIPLSLIMVSLLGHWMGRSDEALNQIMSILSETVPNLSSPFLELIRSIIHKKVQSGWIGIGFLFIVASVLFTQLEKSLDLIFDSIKSRNFFHSRLLSIALIFLTTLFLFIPGVIKTFSLSLTHLHIPFFLSSLLTGHLFYFILSVFSFVLIVALVPNHRILFRYNLIGGLVFATLLLAVKIFFRWYMLFSFERFNLVYGSFTALVIMILWIFYLINLLFLSAELVNVLQKEFNIHDNKKI
ncbi:MAG: YihY/virulence factor BrkB family protein [Deltaproteobacteria bacterium]|nr:YihY/virulence factor BrkB family protein [Deltaproteobacteria bacterium]